MNECDDNNGGCEESCVNTLTSFMCHCSDGYTLASDRFSCEGKEVYNVMYIFLSHALLC